MKIEKEQLDKQYVQLCTIVYAKRLIITIFYVLSIFFISVILNLKDIK